MAKLKPLAFLRTAPVADDDIGGYVAGVVMEPDTVDAQGDFADAAEIRKAMMAFMEESQQIYLRHEGRRVAARVSECFTARRDFKEGGQTIRKGSWYIEVRIRDPQVWEMIEKGDLTGFSVNGWADIEEGEVPGAVFLTDEDVRKAVSDVLVEMVDDGTLADCSERTRRAVSDAVAEVVEEI